MRSDLVRPTCNFCRDRDVAGIKLLRAINEDT
jgi:hypothetical protein